MNIKPKDAVLFTIKEQRENSSSYYLWNWTKKDIFKRVEFYTKQKFINEKLETQLKEIGELIGKVNDLQNKKENLINDREQMEDEQHRIREYISVLGQSSQENV